METNRVLIDYEKMLRREEMSENTIKSYVGTARRFLSAYEALNRNNILAYKELSPLSEDGWLEAEDNKSAAKALFG